VSLHLADEHQIARVVALQFDALERRDHPVHTGAEDLCEAALADDEDEFVVANDLTEHERCTSFLD